MALRYYGMECRSHRGGNKTKTPSGPTHVMVVGAGVRACGAFSTAAEGPTVKQKYIEEQTETHIKCSGGMLQSPGRLLIVGRWACFYTGSCLNA